MLRALLAAHGGQLVVGTMGHSTLELLSIAVCAALLTVAFRPHDDAARVFGLLLLSGALNIAIPTLVVAPDALTEALHDAALGAQGASFLLFAAQTAQSARGAGERVTLGWMRTLDSQRTLRWLIRGTLLCTGAASFAVSLSWLLFPAEAGALVVWAHASLLLWLIGVHGVGCALLIAHVVMSGRGGRRRTIVLAAGALLALVPTLLAMAIASVVGAPGLLSVTTQALLLLALPLAQWVAFLWRRGDSPVSLVDRSSVYLALSCAIFAGYIILVGVADMEMDARQSWESELFTIVAIGIGMVTFTPLRNWLQRRIDILLYRDYYQFGPTLQRLSEHLAGLRDQERVSDLLLGELTEALNLMGAAYVALPEGLDQSMLGLIEIEDLRATGHFADGVGREGVLQGLRHLRLSAFDGAWRGPLLERPWPGCAALVRIGPADADGAFGETLALLVIGAKRTGSPLRDDDRALLTTVAHQAATALANAVLIGGLRTSLEQVRISTAQLVSARAEQQLLLRELVEADERQRAVLARELHDDALQETLYLIRHSRLCADLADQFGQGDQGGAAQDGVVGQGGLSAQGGALRGGGAGTDAVVRRLRMELAQLMERSTVVEQKLRSLCMGLYPALLQSLGLTFALDDLANEMSVSTGMRITLSIAPEVEERIGRLQADVALYLYRIMQEALRNASKHGAAEHATVRIEMRDGAAMGGAQVAATEVAATEVAAGGRRQEALVIEVEDDGCGFTAPPDFVDLLRHSHLGLAGMRERAELVGGEMMITSGAGGGARISMTMPLRNHYGGGVRERRALVGAGDAAR